MPEQTYTIPPLEWKRTVVADTGAYWDASDGWGSFTVYSAAYERWLCEDREDQRPFKPRWTAEYYERNGSYGGTLSSVAKCKAAAEAEHRKQLASLLTPAGPKPEPAEAITADGVAVNVGDPVWFHAGNHIARLKVGKGGKTVKRFNVGPQPVSRCYRDNDEARENPPQPERA